MTRALRWTRLRLACAAGEMVALITAGTAPAP